MQDAISCHLVWRFETLTWIFKAYVLRTGLKIGSQNTNAGCAANNCNAIYKALHKNITPCGVSNQLSSVPEADVMHRARAIFKTP
jgi:hypothetical protein